MSEYDFEGERNRAIVEDFGIAPVGTAPFCEATLAALRRAYAAGQSNGATVTVFGTPSDAWGDLDRLVALAAGIIAGEVDDSISVEQTADLAARMLSALKAQAVNT